MEATLILADDQVEETEDQLVHDWRTEQLCALACRVSLRNHLPSASTGMQSLRSSSVAAPGARTRDRPLKLHVIARARAAFSRH